MGMSPLRSFVFAICVGVAVWGFTTVILKSATVEEPAQTTITTEERTSDNLVVSAEEEEKKASESVRPTISSMIKVAITFVGIAFALMLAFTILASTWNDTRPILKDKNSNTGSQEVTPVKDQDSVKPFLDL